MATPSSTQHPPSNAASGPSAPSRWARGGESSSAFSGLTRGGRGRGSVRGRGGRGGRGGASGREPKPIVDSKNSDKVEKPSVKNASTPSNTSKPLPLATNSQEKGPGTPSSRPKGPPRRVSKTVPVVAVALPAPSTEAPPSPASSRTQNRRRRSQSGKGLVNPLPKIHPPAHDDNLLRPNRNRLGPVPHSAPVKDTPPHLAHVTNSFDMRHNIDALVERVRAVAMADNRPSTPGSHIDWAGDDDDSLPDLDDWGVTPAISTGEKHQMMSPIVVDGLKSLPTDPVVKPLTPSPLEKETLLPSSPAIKSLQSFATSPAVAKSTNSRLSPKDKHPDLIEKGETEDHAIPQTLSINLLNDNTHLSSSKAALHPSLPPKPATAETIIPPKSWHGPNATPMRNPSPPKQPFTDAEVLVEDQGLTHSIHAPELATDGLLSDHKPREGLAASIHAPQNLLESASAPSNLSTYSSSPTEPRIYNPTHTRAHTVGRPIQDHRDNPRTSRSGYSTPRGVSSGGYHARTHSTPPAGSALNNNRPHARPVITGDAISRLARTIGNTTLPATARTASVATAQD
ncbi:hypothetical protein BDZ94DRAFT_1244974 [Collybia nuda]|uniref:Uncharacterized protein n=1 Tax=Collybia nuda TaxID=64659 RepID=A0A9P6CQS7_9AGAR|nr:hypothetical protein BDZ94DRAFT_1244974 [Collybia nuda]